MENEFATNPEGYLAQFDRTASVTFEGKTYQIPDSLLLEMITSRHGVDSSWFVADIVGRVKFLYGRILPRNLAIELTAATIKTTAQDIENTLDWNANYMANHDAMDVEQCHVWPS